MQNLLIVVILAATLTSCCHAEDGATGQYKEFESIARQLDADDSLKTLVHFVDGLDRATKDMANYFDAVAYKNVIESLTGLGKGSESDSFDKQQVLAVLEQCRLVRQRLGEEAQKRRDSGGMAGERDELTKRWLTIDSVCKVLVDEHKSLGYHIHSDWNLVSRNSPLFGLSTFINSIPDEVALDRGVMMDDRLVASEVEMLTEHHMRLAASGRAQPLMRGEPQPRTYAQFLDVTRRACEHLAKYFEPYFRMVEAGVPLDTLNGQPSRAQVDALKSVRVCGRIESIDFEPIISRHPEKLPEPTEAPVKQSKETRKTKKHKDCDDDRFAKGCFWGLLFAGGK